MNYLTNTAKTLFFIVLILTGCGYETKTNQTNTDKENNSENSVPFIYGNLVDTMYSDMDTIDLFQKRLKLIKFNLGTDGDRPYIVLDSNNAVLAVLSGVFMRRAIFTPEGDGSEGLNVDECLINGGGSVKEMSFLLRELEKVVNYMGENAEESIKIVHSLLEEMGIIIRKEVYQKHPLMKNIIENEVELKEYFDFETESYNWKDFEKISDDNRHLFKYHRNLNNWHEYFRHSLNKSNVIVFKYYYNLILLEVVDSKVMEPRYFEETRYMNYKTIDSKVFRSLCSDKP